MSNAVAWIWVETSVYVIHSEMKTAFRPTPQSGDPPWTDANKAPEAVL